MVYPRERSSKGDATRGSSSPGKGVWRCARFQPAEEREYCAREGDGEKRVRGGGEGLMEVYSCLRRISMIAREAAVQ